MLVEQVNKLLGEQLYNETPRMEKTLLGELSEGSGLTDKSKRRWLRGVLYRAVKDDLGNIRLLDTYCLEDTKFHLALKIGEARLFMVCFNRVDTEWKYGKTVYENRVPILSFTILDVVDKESVKNCRAYLSKEDVLGEVLLEKFVDKYQKVLGKELTKKNYAKLMEDLEVLKSKYPNLELGSGSTYTQIYSWYVEERNRCRHVK